MKPFTLPAAPVGPAMLEPLNLCIYGPPGVGKTPICATLPDCGFIDCQRGSLTYSCRRADVRGIAEETGEPCWEVFEECARQFREARVKFIVVDTIGEVADWADNKALARFQNSPIGKSYDKGEGFNEASILDLPGVKGSAGFGRLWDAFQQILDAAMGSWHRAIFIGHPRDKIAFATGADPNVKQDTLVSSEDLDLTGKMRRMFTGKMAAIGYMSRNWEGNGVTVNFASRDAFSKTRCPHLDGRSLPFSNPCTLAEWARIYPNTLSEHLLPADREALQELLSRYGGAAAAKGGGK